MMCMLMNMEMHNKRARANKFMNYFWSGSSLFFNPTPSLGRAF